MTSTTPSRSATHARLIAELDQLVERLPARDVEVRALLRTAASAMLIAVEQASSSVGDPSRQRAAWARCAQSESAVRVALREVRRRRRVPVVEHQRLLDVLGEASRFRNFSFLTAQACIPTGQVELRA